MNIEHNYFSDESEVQAEIEAAGYHAQVAVAQDASNVFAHDEHGRERVVRDGDGWALVDTGLYAHVRHPLYAGAILMAFDGPWVVSLILIVLGLGLPLRRGH